MNISSHKARERYNYTLFTCAKHAILCFLFLTVTLLCTAYYTASCGALVQIVSNSRYVPIPQEEVIQAVKKEPHFRSLTDPKYTLGPKINNWDLNRAKWIRLNPAFPNFLSESKPRVLLVTGSSPKPCANPVGDHYQVKAIKNKIDYCRIHGIDIFYNIDFLDAEMAGFWAKLPLLRTLLLSHPEVLEYFC
jgi:galactosyl transferase GMA12/MNN10 family